MTPDVLGRMMVAGWLLAAPPPFFPIPAAFVFEDRRLRIFVAAWSVLSAILMLPYFVLLLVL